MQLLMNYNGPQGSNISFVDDSDAFVTVDLDSIHGEDVDWYFQTERLSVVTGPPPVDRPKDMTAYDTAFLHIIPCICVELDVVMPDGKLHSVVDFGATREGHETLWVRVFNYREPSGSRHAFVYGNPHAIAEKGLL